MERAKFKELAQERGLKVLSYKAELLGIPQTVEGKEMIIPVSHKPQRLSVEDYEEPREVYEERRKMVKFVEKQYRKGSKFWDSSNLKTYSRMSPDEVQAKYSELISNENMAEKLMEMDQELSKQESLDKFNKETTE